MKIKIPDTVKKARICEILKETDYEKGANYYPYYLNRLSVYNMGDCYEYYTNVESERYSKYYYCTFKINKQTNKVTYMNCDCESFKGNKSCKHLAAIFYYYFGELFKVELTDEMKQEVTLDIFKNLNHITKDTRNTVREEVKIDIELYGNNYNANSRDSLELILKVGTNKLYSCKESKLKNFLKAIKNKEEFSFGKSFVYNPSNNYFSDENQKLIDYLMLLNDLVSSNYYSSNSLLVGRENIKHFLNLVKNRKISINGYVIKEIKNEFPFNSSLDLVDGKYKLKIDFKDSIRFLTGDLEYVVIENTLYHLSYESSRFLSQILESELYELIFTTRKKNSFKDIVLPILKKNIEISENIDDIKICREVKTQLYFDLYRDKITCNVVFLYDDIKVNYFDKATSVLRDNIVENEVIEDLLSLNFKIEDEKIILEDFDNIGEFLEEDLNNLSLKYEVFTSEKIKKIKVVKNNKIKSSFTIGANNILNYSFDLGDIKESEIVNVLESLKNNKKYYRLKSGDLLDLENNDSLKELEKLTDDMNISNKDLENGGGVIPKYRAIYLDSLSHDKYNIIETDNSFNKLIDDFNKYKDSKINLSKEEQELLRNYQIDGVKWLYTIDKTGFGGILADEMGLGKSIQTIYYIKELLKENKDYKFLIVAPTSLAYNWKNEFDKFEPNMKYKIISGLKTLRRKELEDLSDTNILITTYGLLREDREIYENMSFKTMIIDEAQNIKNVNAEVSKTVKRINATTKFALTGTPIENSIAELWSIFDFIMPGFLINLQAFDKKYRVNDFSDDSNSKLQRLNKLVSPFILRRRKKDVIKDLPEKIENNIYVDLTKDQKKIYLAELEKVKDETNSIMETDGIKKVRFMILGLLTKLRQICIDPKILFPEYDGGSGKLEELKKVVLEQIQNGHKILIFTSFKTGLEITREEFNKLGITSYTIDGGVSSKKRMELVDKFNSDDTNVFFIMLKAGGTGLNLTSADVVIHLDLWWNPQAENQATDRAHRIGQKNVVSVIKLISKGTIEEKILELQAKKKILSDKLLDENSQENLFNKLTEKDIKDLLSYDEEE